MARYFKNRSAKAGLPPGSLVYLGAHRAQKPSLDCYSFDESVFQEFIDIDLDNIPEFETNKTYWLNLNGVHNIEWVDRLCKKFEIHPLLAEDILNTEQRAKLDDHENHVFVSLKMIEYLPDLAEIKMEQVSLILGSNYVITFQEVQGDTFDSVRERIRKGNRIRKRGAEYLFYALIDSVVDNYFIALEKIGDDIESLEEDLMSNADQEVLQDLYELKREMISLRRAMWPLREVISKMERQETRAITPETRLYFRDLYDHMIQVIDTIESYRDMLSGMADLYQSTLSNRLNSVMKVLTIISTVFIPITFLTGVYGMNFEWMPALHNPNGFWIVFTLILGSVSTMLIYFRKQKWL
jgi:magnesium transporter